MLKLPHIAGLAQGLSIVLLILAPTHNWDNVVEHKTVRSVTPETFGVSPIGSLPGSKIASMTLFTSGFFRPIELCQHFVSVKTPTFLDSRAHGSTSFRGVFEAFRWGHFVPAWSTEFGSNYAGTYFGGVIFAPERVVLTLHGLAFAFRSTTGLGDPTGYLRSTSVEQRATHAAIKLPAGPSPRPDNG